MPASWMPWPSSVNATAPWAYHVAHLGEHLALQTLGAGAGHVHAALADLRRRGPSRIRRPRRRRPPGSVLGMAHTAVKPPWAAARVPLAMSSFCSIARLAQMHVHVHQAGDDDLAGQVALDALLQGKALAHLDDLAVADEDVGALQSRPTWGSITRAFLSSNAIIRYLPRAGTGRPCARRMPA